MVSLFGMAFSNVASAKRAFGRFDQNGVIADALNIAPRDHVAFPFPEEWEKPFLANGNGQDPSVVHIDLKIGNIPQTLSSAEVDHLKGAKLLRTDSSHIAPPKQ